MVPCPFLKVPLQKMSAVNNDVSGAVGLYGANVSKGTWGSHCMDVVLLSVLEMHECLMT